MIAARFVRSGCLAIPAHLVIGATAWIASLETNEERICAANAEPRSPQSRKRKTGKKRSKAKTTTALFAVQTGRQPDDRTRHARTYTEGTRSHEMTKEELKKVLDLHAAWLGNREG